MVEKPLAANADHANKMLMLAKRFRIQLLTNYETTWYGSNDTAWKMIHNQQAIGDIRKIVFHTGHPGPIEIGCNKEFLEWLTDPVLNGGGALSDFGCYGADIATWLMNGEAPESVTAVTQHIKPEMYPKVEDEATIILTYPKTQVIIQASWNWPYSRKDMEVYGKTGFVICKDKNQMLFKPGEREETRVISAPDLPAGRDDPFAYLAGVIDGTIPVNKYDLSAPATNEIVMRILEAAKESARTGQTIRWNEFYKTRPVFR
jgi:predicted dehydrogenase